MRSAMPSASERSILPLANARRENSPGGAGLHPSPMNRWMISRTIQREPWQVISTVSCPVKDAGAWNGIAITSSMVDPSLPMIRPWMAVRGFAAVMSGPLHAFAVISITPVPEIRMSASAPEESGVQSAITGSVMRVSICSIGGMMRWLLLRFLWSPGVRRRGRSR